MANVFHFRIFVAYAWIFYIKTNPTAWILAGQERVSDGGDCDRSQMKILASRRILYGSGRRFALADASGPLM